MLQKALAWLLPPSNRFVPWLETSHAHRLPILQITPRK